MVIRPIYAHIVISGYLLAHIAFMYSQPSFDFCGNHHKKMLQAITALTLDKKKQCDMRSTSLVANIQNPLNAENLPLDDSLDNSSAQLVINAL